MKKYLVIFLFSFLAINLFGTTYDVGPKRTYAKLGAVPWVTLTAGDTVLIFWRSTPYASKIYLRAQGTKDNPVVIKGVPNSNGDLPILTGKNATTHPQFIGYFDSVWTENLALFFIQRGPQDDYYTYKPKHITFEYLEITGVKPENTFIDQFGNVRHYDDFGTAIAGWVCENLTIRYCKIYDNSQAIFTNTNGTEEGQISRNLLIEYNEIWGNGIAGPDGRHHNIYAQAAGTIIQFNKIGSLREGSVGSSLKDRSSGTVIRYNWIESSGRTLDLVEVEDGWQVLMQEPNYHNVYVYGNIILNDLKKNPFSSNMIHFGFDNSPEEAKRGTLYFYNNTVYIKGDEEDYWFVNLFDVPDDQNAATAEGTVAMYNNIIQKDGSTHLQMMRDGGTLNFFANNWINENYTALANDATAQVNYITNPLLGTDPGFNNVAEEDFTLVNSSPCINRSGTFPTSITTNYPLNKEYVKHSTGKERNLVGSAFDLGAFEYNEVVSVRSGKRINNKSFKLFQNYPNPFNPCTTITYKLEASGFVTLKIYNILGKEVATIVNEKKGPGNYSLSFNAEGIPSGIYIYKLTTLKFTKAKKMMYLK